MPNPFEYRVHVYPHHTDYSGSVWHGAYIQWMEEVRVAYLQAQGLIYADLVADDCELPVVDLALRYRHPVKMGMDLLWIAGMHPLQGVRLVWDYELRSLDKQILYLTAQVTLVPIRSTTGKILRQLPPLLKTILSSSDSCGKPPPSSPTVA
jgi:acyl-CoA thioester hydrolase